MHQKHIYNPKKNLYKKLNIILISLLLKRKLKIINLIKVCLYILLLIHTYNNISLNHFFLRQRIFKLILFHTEYPDLTDSILF